VNAAPWLRLQRFSVVTLSVARSKFLRQVIKYPTLSLLKTERRGWGTRQCK
jgi:hypothetical protein